MGKFKKMLAVVLAGSVMLGMAGCSKGNKIKALTEKEYKKILLDDVGVEKDDYHTFDGAGLGQIKAYDGETIQARYKSCVAFISIFDEADDAEDFFEELIGYTEDFAGDERRMENLEMCDGELIYESNDGYGYIIMTCNAGPVLSFFGDANVSTEDFYGAVYYADNVVVRIVPEAGIYEDGDSKHIIEIIEALGYPTMEDVGDSK